MLKNPEITTIAVPDLDKPTEKLTISLMRMPLQPEYIPVKLNHSQQQIIEKLRQSKQLRQEMRWKLNKNSQVYNLDQKIFGENQSRPLSAYYYLMDREVVVEAGLINGSGKAALHENLRLAQEHDWLRSTSIIRYSGHVWYLPDLNSAVALFENQENTTDWHRGMINIVDTLTADGFVCVGSDCDPLYDQAAFSSFFTRTQGGSG